MKHPFRWVLAGAAFLGLAWGFISFHPMKVSPLVRQVDRLVQIGALCKGYADANDGHFPPDWSVLTNAPDPAVFRLGRNKGKVGSMANVMEWTDFIYLTDLTTSSPTNAILAFLPPGQYPSDNRGLMLFADLHVESVSPDQFTRKMSESQQALRQANLAYKGGRSELAWVRRAMRDHPNTIIDWITLMIHKGTNAPYWSFDNGKGLNQPEFERILGKMEQYGAGELFLYGEEDVTVQQVELTLDILRDHSVTNVWLFQRVQGVLDPPFEMPEGLRRDDEVEETNSPLRIKF